MRSDGLKKTLEHLRQTLAPPEESARTDGQLLASFVANRDESAFAALVRRHGRMVFGVCRRLLGHVQDAEDAFQATFLVLACKASSLRDGESVGNWLYGVAYRTALESRSRLALRRSREQPLDNAPSPEVPPEEPRDWLPLLERALNSLPQRYRTPLVLCHLEGRSRQEVAHQLGLPEGTLSSRLATARQLLAKRLARHRLTLSLGALLATLADETASAAMPASLFVATVQDALRIAAGQTVATPAAVLMKKVLQMMLLTKLKIVTVCLASVGVMGVLVASFFAPMRAADEKPAEPKPASQPAAKERLATKITRLDNEIGDVASLLRVYKEVSDVELRPEKAYPAIGVDIELYKKGQKQKTDFFNRDHFPFVNIFQQVPIDRVKVALLAADLDYLPLAEARKGHYRMHVQMGIYRNKGQWLYSTLTCGADIPKELFDFNGAGGTHQFTRGAGSATETPLFYIYRFVGDSRPKGHLTSETVSELIEWSSTGDLLIVYLRVGKNADQRGEGGVK